MSSKKKTTEAAPAAAQPAEEELVPILPTGEDAPQDGSGSSTDSGSAPAVEELVEDAPLTQELTPEQKWEPFIDALAPIPLELIPRLTFHDRDGNRYYLDPWHPAGTFLLRPRPQ